MNVSAAGITLLLSRTSHLSYSSRCRRRIIYQHKQQGCSRQSTQGAPPVVAKQHSCTRCHDYMFAGGWLYRPAAKQLLSNISIMRTFRLMLYTMKVLSWSVSCCCARGPPADPVSAWLLRVVRESARFCMVHSIRPARTSRSSWMMGSKNFT